MATAAKYWGDESVDDAIYSVYLRKVRYVAPNRCDAAPQKYRRPIDAADSSSGASRVDDDDATVDHLQWETVKERVIKCGSVDRLLESLVTVDGVLDTRHFNVFFATYRAFTSNADVLAKLIDRYELIAAADVDSIAARPSRADMLDSLRSVLVCWLDLYRDDFYEPSSDYAQLDRLVDFGKRHQLKEVRSRARRLKDRFMRIHADGGPIAQLPSIDKHATTFGFESSTDNVDDRWTIKTVDICRENALQIAEQLTFWDAELFKSLLPHQCQGCVWSRRHKTNAEKVYTVRATINQFNAVSMRVMASIVVPECKPEMRAKIIAKWIDVAKELRTLKNFSSLKAVLSSLQSESVHRLKSVWSYVPSRSLSTFRELSSIFEDESDDDGRSRRSADEESSLAKSSPFRRPQTSCRRSKSDVNLSESPGTVPYLGNFLTDLAMIDEAHPDYTEEGLINFEKRRKEFEVLAKIRLFQSAARSYNIPMDRGFCTWFNLLPSLPENDCFSRSLFIEKPMITNSSTPDMKSISTSRLTSSNLSASSSNGHLPKINSLSRLLTSMMGDEVSTPTTNGDHRHACIDTEDSWQSGIPTSCSSPHHHHLNEHHSMHHHHLVQSEQHQMHLPQLMTRSVTAPSTPGGTISWRHGRSTFYEIGSEFNPSRMFGDGAQRSGSGRSSKKGSDSLSRSSTNTADLAMIDVSDARHSRSVTPQHHLESNNHAITCDNNNSSKHPTQTAAAAGLNYGSGSSQSSSSAVSSTSSSSAISSATTTNSNTNTDTILVGNNNHINYHIARVGLDDDGLQAERGGIANYKCIKVENGDRMSTLIDRILEKHLIESADRNHFCLVQLLPDGGEFQLPDKCNPFYAVAPDSSSSMLNFVLRRRPTTTTTPNSTHDQHSSTTTTNKKQNRIKRSNLLRWSSGYL